MATWSRRTPLLLAFCLLATVDTVAGAPEGFPASGNGVWDNAPGTSWARGSYPIGNGYLAAMIPGGTTLDMMSLNLESLWPGGPFQNSSYNGGNRKASERASLKTEMDRIRSTVFSSSNGTAYSLTSLMTDPINFGNYAGAGYLFTTVSNKDTVTDYARWLDLDEAVMHATWTAGSATIDRKTFCSHPAQACVQQTSSSASQNLTFAYSLGPDPGLTAIDVTCLDSSTLQVRGHAGSPGMLYEILFHASSSTASCQSAQPYNTSVATSNATLSASGADVTVVWVGNTEYSMDAGDEAHNFSFKGDDPHSALASRISSLSGTSAATLLSAHVADVKATLTGPFKLDLGQTAQLDSTTATVLTAYKVDTGNPYIEWLLFNFGRYMLWSSSRGTLPANLQGKWAHKFTNTWNSDYHVNINVQMNLWSAESTNLDVTQSVFDYMEKTWVPRGTQTAQILYDSDEGWVTHDEVNIFGHTGMKTGTPQSLNYPEANAWMMVHVWDHFDYTNDVSWWKSQGYPLLKGTAQFHLNKLIPDLHFNDSSLVVAPCNSPEQGYITLGCAHAQQLIWQLFNAVEKGFSASGDTDTDFLNAIRTARTQMDKGIHIGSWGQLQEWKVDLDDPDDVHRHLSHLVGLYPGYAIASYDVAKQGTAGSSNLSYTKAQVIDATTISLTHRGDGTGSDDAGWEKMWRAASWAQLGNAEQFYHEITLAIDRNFVATLWSTYDPAGYEPVQIDANLGHPAAVLNALFQAPDVASYDDPLIVTLLPALPAAWPKGSIAGARLRGGMSIDFSWSGGALDSATITVANSVVPRDVQVVVDGKVVKEFTTKAGMVQTI
ncbi:glycoside hydrolase family 95 protein [Schizophyllum amplum]|uniref:Glycoside hydrolase family 95 protein n=1 Tax=Schizophyllum amplum TaxID=97359 RepID=A0A550CP59_9AGAR|nr:glycoside hydrolase family 95 protein [Auriculariopsis ampla]